MKKSQFIHLALLGTGLIVLQGCDDKEKAFKDEQECLKTNSAEKCRQAFNQSQAMHAASAPKFMSREDCEKQFGVGKCTGTPPDSREASGGGMFMPMMAGFMMGKMMGGGHVASGYRHEDDRRGSRAGAAGYLGRPSASAKRGGFGGSASYFSAGS
jgi:uncharacterized protein YgiB involved in biofilm formation